VALWSELDLSGIKDDITNIPDLNLEMLGIEEFSIEPEVVEGECDEDEVPEVVEWRLNKHSTRRAANGC